MSIHVSPSPSTAAPELGEAYRRLARRLEQNVRLNVATSDTVVEEACQIAWGRLLHARQKVRAESTLSWLTKTAVREALRLHLRERRQLSLDAALDDVGEPPLRPVPGPEALVERRERLSAIGALPERQQRVLWLQALGLSHSEIAQQTGDSARTVERQLVRARRALRAVAA